MKLGVANSLTIFRAACIPIFILFFALKLYAVALVIFALAAFTDLIDGTVARLRNEHSQLGAILDPLADKGLMLSLFIGLLLANVVSLWFVILLLLRDVVVIGGLAYLRIKKITVQYQAILVSKCTTLLEIVTGTCALVYLVFPQAALGAFPVGDVVYGLVMVTAILLVVTTMQYIKIGLEILASTQHGSRQNA